MLYTHLDLAIKESNFKGYDVQIGTHPLTDMFEVKTDVVQNVDSQVHERKPMRNAKVLVNSTTCLCIFIAFATLILLKKNLVLFKFSIFVVLFVLPFKLK